MKKFKKFLALFALILITSIGHGQTWNLGSERLESVDLIKNGTYQIGNRNDVSLISPKMIIGYNSGQMHHFAQLSWNKNGYVTDEFVEKVKKQIPENQLEYFRVTGTMANQWALDLNGYNHFLHDNQINNRKDVKQPTQSYFYAFVDFYKKVGFNKLVWTLNTISAWSNPKERTLWENRMWAMLDEIDKAGIEIAVISMENEMWMYADCVVMGNGNLNIVHKIAIAGWKGIFMSDNAMKPLVQKGMKNYLSYLENISKQIKKRYPKVKIGISIDNDTHLRGKWLGEVIKSYNFYDIVEPHIYITPSNKKDLYFQVKSKIDFAKTFDKEVWVTEWNWDYGVNDQGQSQGDYHDNNFHDDMISTMQELGVLGAFEHAIGAGNSSYGAIKY